MALAGHGDRFGDRLPVADPRLVHFDVEMVIALEPVADHLEVQLAHPADQRLAVSLSWGGSRVLTFIISSTSANFFRSATFRATESTVSGKVMGSQEDRMLDRRACRRSPNCRPMMLTMPASTSTCSRWSA